MRAIANFCKALLRYRVLWGACGLLAVCALLSGIAAFPTYGIDAQREELRQSYGNLADGLDSGAFETAPNELKDLLSAKRDALGTALEAGDTADFYTSAAQVSELDLEGIRLGYVSSDEALAQAELEYSRGMAGNGAIAKASNAAELDALEGFTVAIASMPEPLWYCAALVLVARALSLSRAGRLFEAPCLSAPGRCALFLTPVIACSALCFVAFLAPGFVGNTLRNGMGNPDQPITYVVDGEVHVVSLGSSCANLIASLMFGTVFLACLALFFWRITGSVPASLAGVLVVTVLPLVPVYFEAQGPFAAVVPFLPSTYLCPAAFLPCAGNPPYQLMTCPVEINPLIGIAILAGSSLALAVVSSAIDALSLGRPSC